MSQLTTPPPDANNTSPAAALQGALAQSFARVPVTVQIMLGSTKLALPDLLDLTPGAVLTLDQKLGSPVSVIVNGCKVASGELYVLEGETDRLGVKILEISDKSQAG